MPSDAGPGAAGAAPAPDGEPRVAIVGGLLADERGARPGTLLLGGGVIAGVLPPATRRDPAAASGVSGWSIAGNPLTDVGEIIDATGLTVLPGGIDLHTHLGEPGSEDRETFLTGTRAAICGGVTTVFEMPLSDPPTTTGDRYASKLAMVERGVYANVGLWGGLVPGNGDEMRAQFQLGARGFKAFTCPSGTPFPMSSAGDLEAGMRVAADLGALVLVHCEEPTAFVAQPAGVPLTAAAFRTSRPVRAEIEAVRHVLHLAERTGCRVQIVHVSTGPAVDLILAAQDRGVTVSFEHTAHHLLLDGDDADRLGPLAHCAPAVRDAAESAALWERLAAGSPAMIASDHVPATLAEKLAAADDLTGCPLGIQGVQDTHALILDALVHGRPVRTDDSDRSAGALGIGRAVSLLAAQPARAAGLWPRKGTLERGADADITLWDLAATRTLDAATGQQNMQRWSPYDGCTVRATPVRTLLAGRSVAIGGAPVGPPSGRVIR